MNGSLAVNSHPDPKHAVTENVPADLTPRFEVLDNDPVVPPDYWRRVRLIFVVICVGMGLGVGIVLEKVNKDIQPGLVGVTMLVGFFGWLLMETFRKHKAFFNQVQGVITHGQIGFRCQHSVEEILALQVVRVPPTDKEKVRYQLNLVLNDPAQPRCFLFKERDYLSLKQKGKDWAEKMRVPLLDRVEVGNNPLPWPKPAFARLINPAHQSAIQEAGLTPGGEITQEEPPNLLCKPLVSHKTNLWDTPIGCSIFLFFAFLAWFFSHFLPSWLGTVLSLVITSLGVLIIVVFSQKKIHFETQQLHFGFPGFRQKRSILGFQFLIVNKDQEIYELNVLINDAQKPRIHFFLGVGLEKGQSYVRYLADILKVPVWKQTYEPKIGPIIEG